MKPPVNIKFVETPAFTYWFDENGILCAKAKEGERTLEQYIHFMEPHKKLSAQKGKLCFVLDITSTKPLKLEVSEYVINEIPKYIKAFALISTAQLDATQTKTFLKLTMTGFPIKIFPNESEAKEWLNEYL